MGVIDEDPGESRSIVRRRSAQYASRYRRANSSFCCRGMWADVCGGEGSVLSQNKGETAGRTPVVLVAVVGAAAVSRERRGRTPADDAAL